jgi:hypothetical protein
MYDGKTEDRDGCIVMGRTESLNFVGPVKNSYLAAKSAWQAVIVDIQPELEHGEQIVDDNLTV